MEQTEQSPVNKKSGFKRLLKTLLLLGGITIVLILLTLLWLKLYTNHGEAFSVPNFKGHTIEEAKVLAKKKKLRLQIIDSVYNAPGERGTIILQNPPPDFKVKTNRRIFATIKSVTPKLLDMPDFTDMTFIQAKADIESYGLTIGEISYKPSIYDNVVLEQRYRGNEITPGTEIEKYSAIDLVLGESGNMQNTNTPILIGLTEEEAQSKINNHLLNIGTVLYDQTVITTEDSLKAMVRKQFPVPNVPLNPGDEIDLWMSMLQDTIFEENMIQN
ncbi:MAG: PASTA domain-containing protein [Bacteroidota bacterium]|nr:PASTA domain-containing protein [Bacteroidota bacterium]